MKKQILAIALLLLQQVLANPALAEVNGRMLYPNLRKFPTFDALVNSYLWNYITLPSADASTLSTAIYVEESKTIFVPQEPKPRNLVSTGKELLGLAPKPAMKMTEIDLGADIRVVGVDYFPVLMLSAEFAKDNCMLEQELTVNNRVVYRPGATNSFGLINLLIKVSLGMSFGSGLTDKEVITCMARPGGKVQLQMSNRMIHFPQARTREVSYTINDKTLLTKMWTPVVSSLQDEEHVGALFYENFKLGKYRCVTQVEYFELPSVRKWLEWSQPYAAANSSAFNVADGFDSLPSSSV